MSSLMVGSSFTSSTRSGFRKSSLLHRRLGLQRLGAKLRHRTQRLNLETLLSLLSGENAGQKKDEREQTADHDANDHNLDAVLGRRCEPPTDNWQPTTALETKAAQIAGRSVVKTPAPDRHLQSRFFRYCAAASAGVCEPFCRRSLIWVISFCRRVSAVAFC